MKGSRHDDASGSAAAASTSTSSGTRGAGSSSPASSCSISLGSLALRDVNAGLEFRGGTAFQVRASRSADATVADMRSRSSAPACMKQRSRRSETEGSSSRPSTSKRPYSSRVVDAVAKTAGVEASEVNVTDVGPKWGAQITSKAIRALVIFLVFVVIYLSIRLEPKMAGAAMVALVHDMILTAGIYSLTGFEVTPATVIALLTILGYSLYDTVVIFDRVKERTQNLSAAGRVTYAEAANDSLNQVLVRSINTTVVVVAPRREPALRRLVPPRRPDAARARARALHRHRRRRVLVDLHRHTAAGDMEGTRAAVGDVAGAHRRAQRGHLRTAAAAAGAASTRSRSGAGGAERSDSPVGCPSLGRRPAQAPQARPPVTASFRRASAEPRPRRPRLPAARHRLQGHHAVARRRASLRDGGRPLRPSTSTGRESTASSASRRAGFIVAAPVAYRLGGGIRPGPEAREAAVGDHRRRLRAGVRRRTARAALRRRVAPGTACSSSTTCSRRAGRRARPPMSCDKLGAEVVGIGVIIELAFLNGRDRLDGIDLYSILTY